MASTGEVWKLGHRPALDGVRGIAVLLVLAGHGWVPVDIGGAGKVGVAVFFTLSGFLITTLLLEERTGSGRVDYRAFYVRRARRLMPAALVAVAVFWLFAYAFDPTLLPARSAAAAILYLGNVHPFGLVGHFWSLAVEEQFYLVLPAVLAALLRHRVRHLSGWLMVGAGVSLVLRLAVGGTLLPQQADALLVGCALAAWMRGREERAVSPTVPIAALGGLLGLCLLPTATAETWGIAAAGVLAAVLLWAVGQANPPRAIEARWLRWVGRRSYALYLWHYPIGFVVAERLGVTSWPLFVAVVAPLSLAATVASWRWVETPLGSHSHAEDGKPRGAARSVQSKAAA